MNMNKISQWMKGNMLIVGALGLSFLCLGFVGFVTLFKRGSVVKQVEAKVSKQIAEADKLMDQTIKVPGPRVGDKQVSIKKVTIGPKLLEARKVINDRFVEVGRRMRDLVQKENGSAHENACILPPEGLNTLNIADALAKYKNSFVAALWNPNLNAGSISEEDRKKVGINPLYAGTAYSAEELQAIANAVVKERVEGFGAEKLGDLSAKQQQQVTIRARNAVLAAIEERAKKIGVYVEKTGISDTACPLGSGLIRDWGRLPSPELAYESQADLWILRDMVEVIRKANRIGEPGQSVLTGPVKRLLRLQINQDGYVGLHTMGWATGASSLSSSSKGALAFPSSITLPDASRPQVENFFASPTGRISNALYDVKQVRLDVLVDGQRLPELFAAIDKVNFMTVLDVGIEDVDEYKELRDGRYYYGKCDVVRASILVETLWMRSWTTPKMPEGTKRYLGIGK